MKSLEDENRRPGEAAGGVDAGQRGAQGPARKKRLAPAARREAVMKRGDGASRAGVIGVRGSWSGWIVRLCATGADDRTSRHQGSGLENRHAQRRRFGPDENRGWMLKPQASRALNHKKLSWSAVPRRAAAHGAPAPQGARGHRVPAAPRKLFIRINQRWSLDFVSDT